MAARPPHTRAPSPSAPVPEGRRHPVAIAFAEALEETVCPGTGDLSGAEQEGVGWADLAIANGERVSPADAYLKVALGRPNLPVIPNAALHATVLAIAERAADLIAGR